jgi:hypothetical protein
MALIEAEWTARQADKPFVIEITEARISVVR